MSTRRHIRTGLSCRPERSFFCIAELPDFIALNPLAIQIAKRIVLILSAARGQQRQGA